MTRSRPFVAFALTSLLGACLAGCNANPDQTGDGERGLGPAGTNATDAPQTPEEQYKRQLEDAAKFKKTYKPK